MPAYNLDEPINIDEPVTLELDYTAVGVMNYEGPIQGFEILPNSFPLSVGEYIVQASPIRLHEDLDGDLILTSETDNAMLKFNVWKDIRYIPDMSYNTAYGAGEQRLPGHPSHKGDIRETLTLEINRKVLHRYLSLGNSKQEVYEQLFNKAKDQVLYKEIMLEINKAMFLLDNNR